ncbi:MAG: hypothetical protein V4813_05040 [Gemmatimonadota bacterium]
MITPSFRNRSGSVAGYVVTGLVIAAALGSIPFLRQQRTALQRETATLRAEQPTLATTLDSLTGVVTETRATLTLEQARAAARAEPKLHLVIAVDSGTMALVRDGITLRTMSARFTGEAPARGTQVISSIAVRPVQATVPTVDSLGTTVTAAPVDSTVERVTLSDGTLIEGGDAAAVMLGGVEVAPGPRMILLSRRDFAAIRPNLVKGMKAVSF